MHEYKYLETRNSAKDSVSTVRIVIIDREPLFRKGIKTALESFSDFWVMDDYDEMNTALLTDFEKILPHVIIMDVISHESSRLSMQMIRLIISKFPLAKIVLMTRHKNERLIKEAIISGITACLPKTAEVGELIHCLREAAMGRSYFSPSLVPSLKMLLGAFERDSDPQRAKFLQLTKREKEVLRLISTGLSRREISDRLFISVKTVSSHRENIMYKLDIETTAELIKYAVALSKPLNWIHSV